MPVFNVTVHRKASFLAEFPIERETEQEARDYVEGILASMGSEAAMEALDPEYAYRIETDISIAASAAD